MPRPNPVWPLLGALGCATIADPPPDDGVDTSVGDAGEERVLDGDTAAESDAPGVMDTAVLEVELPLTALQLRAVRPSTDLGCVGVAAFPGGIFDECSPSAWLTRDPATGEPFGLLEALLVVEHTRSVRLMTVPGMPTLCTFLAGADCDTALAPWPNPPDASASGRPAWRLVGNFSAVAARIAP